MYFNSMQYFVFFILAYLGYYICPKKIRYIWLLITSYYFYMTWNIKYGSLLLLLTVITYFSALGIQRLKIRDGIFKTRMILAATIIICFGFLVYFKYANFIIDNLNFIIKHTGKTKEFTALDVILPIGISFYVLQATGYVIDVYRGIVHAERNFLRYALFVSFFPLLISGPIERSINILPQFKNPNELTGMRFREGIILILVGIWEKVLIADNIALIIDPIFSEYSSYSGSTLVIAVVLFGIQIYCDFSGYSCIAIGCAKLLGIDIMNNFNTPYLATSVSDFWRRWHISLTSWFRDYLYIPMGGSRKGKVRTYINTLVVFFVSGLWHGASWNYIVWGTFNGFMLVVSKARKQFFPYKATKTSKVDILGKRIGTFLLIDFAWLFFKVQSVRKCFDIVVHSARHLGLRALLQGTTLDIFGSTQMRVVLLISFIILFNLDKIQDKTGNFISYIGEQKVVYRWGFYLTLLLMVVFWGAYGEGYEQTGFIYFQF